MRARSSGKKNASTGVARASSRLSSPTIRIPALFTKDGTNSASYTPDKVVAVLGQRDELLPLGLGPLPVRRLDGRVEHAADAAGPVGDRAEGVGKVAGLVPAAPADDERLVLGPDRRPAREDLPEQRLEVGPDLGPHLAPRLPERPRVLRGPERLAVPVVVDEDQVGTPPHAHGEPGAEADPDGRLELGRPRLARPERGGGPVEVADDVGHRPVGRQSVRGVSRGVRRRGVRRHGRGAPPDVGGACRGRGSYRHGGPVWSARLRFGTANGDRDRPARGRRPPRRAGRPEPSGGASAGRGGGGLRQERRRPPPEALSRNVRRRHVVVTPRGGCGGRPPPRPHHPPGAAAGPG